MSEDRIEISCPHCSTSYALDKAVIGIGKKALKCAVCSSTFVVESSSPAQTADESFAYDPETSPWDTDPESDPVLQQESEEPEGEKETSDNLEEAWVDYDSMSLDDLTFGEDDDAGEALEFGTEDESSEMASEEETDDSGPVPQPHPPHLNAIEKIDASDDRYTLDGRPAKEIDEHIRSYSNELEPPEVLAQADEEDERISSLSDVEMPDDPDDVSEYQEDSEEEESLRKSPLAALVEAEQAADVKRQPPKKKRGGSFTKNERSIDPEKLESSSGMIYYILIILIGAAGLATTFVKVGDMQFDPVWSISMIVIGVMGFFLQNLSGIYIAGFFSVLYSFGLFSQISGQLNSGIYNGVIHLAVIFALAFVISVAYALLIGRRSGHFVLIESSFQSILSFVLGLLAIIYGYWSYIDSAMIAPLGEWVLMGRSINSYIYYGIIPLQTIIQAATAAGAIAFGISAHRLRNRMLILAKLAILFGIIIIMLLFTAYYIRNLTFSFPV